VLLAFVPSSLMLSVTTYISADIAAIPLLWVVPLALYLLTFILVFAARPPIPHRLAVRAFPIVLLPLVVVFVSHVALPLPLQIALHLLVFFAAALVCHGELARQRPDPRHLTAFYLWMSLGGVLGGLFNAIVAPLLFTGVVEYPLTLVFACLLVPAFHRRDAEPALPLDKLGNRLSKGAQSRQKLVERRARLLDLLLPAVAGVLTALLLVALPSFAVGPGAALAFGAPALLCLSFTRRPLRFGLGVGAVLLAGALYANRGGETLYTERSFFGIHRVSRLELSDSGTYHALVHGNTLHGMQSQQPARSREPLTYYYRSGPLGQAFEALGAAKATQPVAAVGLGAGSVACYAQPGQAWTFYEIDPAVERIARDPRFFTFLRDCAPDAPVVLGDARLTLARAPDGAYGWLILDAYSSDAPPLHLLTREALQLYVAKLAPDGVLALHITNRHLDLEPVLGNLARDAGLAALIGDGRQVGAQEAAQARTGSRWVLMARSPAHLGLLANDARWQPLTTAPDQEVWTDDFSSLLSVFLWK
jgi:hypothetical protein